MLLPLQPQHNQKDHLLYAIDRKSTELQRKDKWFLIIPPTVIQLPDYSDIEGKHTDYIWHLTDINKTEFLKQKRLEFEKQKRLEFEKLKHKEKLK